VQFKVTITNNNGLALSGLVVKTIQERHNDVTIWDRQGELVLHKGQPLDGSSTYTWLIDSIAPGETITLLGYYCYQGRGWGLDQTHLRITSNGMTVVNDSEAGVYCPP